MSEELTFKEKLQRILGYVQNDSHRKITIDQDDATCYYILKVGDKSYRSNSLEGLINEAYEGEGDPW